LKFFEGIIYALIIALAVSFSLAPHVSKRVLIASDDHDAEYPTTRGLYKIKEIIERETGGALEVIVRHSAQLGSEKETIELTQMGIIDIDRVSCAAIVNFAPEMGVFSLPYIFRDSKHEWKVLNGEVGRELGERLNSVDLVTLTYYDSGARSFYNKHRPINSPADLKGLKIRVQQNPVMIDLVKALGASPTPMAFEEVYSAIQTGVIDGAENNPPSYVTTGHYEVAKYYSLDEHSRIPEIVLFSKKVWDSLPERERAIIAAAARESQSYQIGLWKAQETEGLKVLRAAGIKINTPAKQPFEDAVKPLYKNYGADLGTLIDRIKAVK